MILLKIVQSRVNLFKTSSIIKKSKQYYNPNYYSTMAKPTLYLTREINEEAFNLLKERFDVSMWLGPGAVPREELLKNIPNKDALFCLLTDKIDLEVIQKANKLKILGTMSVGYDHLDLKELKSRNIKIGYTPGVLTDATAELTMSLLLATSRRLLESNEEAKNGRWSTWSPFWMCGPGLSNSTVGIVGFGRIGQTVAKMLKPFNVKQILYHNRSEKSKEAEEIGAKRVDFDTLIKTSDFIIATISLTPETEGLFNKDVFKMMKKSAVFVNTSRGGVVNQDDLVDALESGAIWAAGLDVTTPEPLPVNHKLFMLKNCVVLPHIGSASIQTRKNMAMMTVKNILAALDGEKMPGEL
nr:glyoxylate reductase/hydroxypyruvate reductase [Onthophagus taurus]